MSDRQSTSEGSIEVRERKLPWHDWIALPLLALLTISVMYISSKSLAGRMFAVYGNLAQNCLSADPSVGVRGVPNTVCRAKLSEGEATEYKFNRCGDRSGMECGPKAPGIYRIVMTGSSFVFGDGEAREKTFAALLPAELSQRTGRPVEVYNEGLLYKHPRVVAQRFDEVLAAQPDMILWILTPYDVKESSILMPPPSREAVRAQQGAPGAQAGYLARIRYNVNTAFANKSIAQGFQTLWNTEFAQFEGGLTALMLEHFLYESQSQYVKAYLMGGEGDRDTVFLRTEPTPQWRDLLQQFDGYAAEIGSRAKAANVPLVAVMIPQRGQAAMISMGEWPAGFDPYKLDNQLRAIIESRGGTYISILSDYRGIPNPEKGFLPVDGHPNAQGHAIISHLLAGELTAGTIPALKANPLSKAY